MLRCIERVVGKLLPQLKIAAALVHGHTGAERDMERRSIGSRMRDGAEVRDQAGHQALNLAGGDVAKEEGELLTTVAADLIAGAKVPLEECGERGQDAVTGQVTIAVVHALEVIEID